MQISWITCGEGRWCSLEQLDLLSIKTTVGVYVIWHAGRPSRVVHVGQGNIARRLALHRADPQIMQYRERGRLLVTWAAVSNDADRVGIERFLVENYRPLVANSPRAVVPLAVNFPGAA
jgi:hypothetical protein